MHHCWKTKTNKRNCPLTNKRLLILYPFDNNIVSNLSTLEHTLIMHIDFYFLSTMILQTISAAIFFTLNISHIIVSDQGSSKQKKCGKGIIIRGFNSHTMCSVIVIMSLKKEGKAMCSTQ